MPVDDAVQRADTIRSELLEDVKAWTVDDLNRALGMANAVLDRNVPFSPLYVLGDGPVGSTLEDRTFLAGYWQSKTGKAWNPMELLESMSHVTLDDLKEHATSILNSAKTKVLTAG